MSSPQPPDPVTARVTRDVAGLLSGEPSPRALRQALRLLAKWRSAALAGQILQRDGAIIQRGPFAGMSYLSRQSEGALIPRLLGSYEATLHPIIDAIIARGYRQVLDVGAAEGYYAVGLALRMPRARVLAYDIDPNARALLARLAEANGVSDRIVQHEACTHASFALCSQAPTVVICDIEGAEDQLLDPDRAPGLRDADILVETHPGLVRGVTDRIAARFADSHRVTRIDRRVDSDALPGWMEQLDDMDRLIAIWEWRSAPTPWLWMTRR